MKDHQFALIPTDFDQEVSELKTIHFLESDEWKQLSTTTLFSKLLVKTQVNQSTTSQKEAMLHNLLLDDQHNGSQISTCSQVNATNFYNVALQLLGFLVETDFKIDHSIDAMQKMNLPIYQSNHENWDNQDLIQAWYLLLNTRGKNGQPFLDVLASQGYFKAFSDLPHPLVFNGKSQAVFDTDKLIREVVYVEAPLDTDHDGKRDLLRVEITRPSETNQGLKVPVIFTASPYNQGTNDEDGLKMTHNVNTPLKHKRPGVETIKTTERPDNTAIPEKRKIKSETDSTTETFEDDWTYTLNDYFLARGFAVAYSSGIGTKYSDGFRTTGDQLETISTTAVIEWLTGNRVAFTNKTDNQAIKAWWSNHNIGMTGRSYLGTLQIAAAATNVSGLKACIPEAAISSWYDYYRENGLVAAPGGFQGEDADVLAEETFSRQQTAGDYWQIHQKWQTQLQSIAKGQDRDSGNYNQFWDNANYIKRINQINAGMLIVHGLNDWNVKPRNSNHLWKKINQLDGKHKIILHQGEHIYINNFQSIDFSEIANLWMTKHLLNVDNQVETHLPNVMIQDNVLPQTWTSYSNWDHSEKQELYPQASGQLTRTKSPQKLLKYQDSLTQNQLIAYTINQKNGDYTKWINDLFNSESPLTNQRLLFKTKPLSTDMWIDGTVTLKLTIKSDHQIGLVSAFLIDYGDAKRFTITPQNIGIGNINLGYHWRKDTLRDFKLQDHSTPFKKISEAHLNLQNINGADKVNEVIPNHAYHCQFNFQPTFYHLPKGRQLGLVICGTDLTTTIRDLEPINYQIELSTSCLQVPFKQK